MNQENKELALSKMLEEMNEKHSASEDKIHNWLCDQDDNVLTKHPKRRLLKVRLC